MKHCLGVILLMLLCVGSTRAATVPTFADNHVSASSTQGYGVTRYDFRLPNGTMSGNCIIVGFQYSATAGVTAAVVSDDQNNTYSTPIISNSDGRQVVNLAFALNVAAGTQRISIAFTGGPPPYVSALATEFYNIATANAMDGSSGSNGTGTSVAAGPFTPSTDGDLIYQYSVQDSSSMTSWSQGVSPWILLSSDILDGSAAQYEVQSSAALINPTMGMAPAQNFNSVAIALKAANAGSAPPAGIRVVRVQHHSVSDANSTVQLQFPCTGNLIVLAWIGAPGHDITGVADGNGNPYVSPSPAYGNSISGDSQIYYVANASTSTTMTGPTLTINGTDSSGSTAVLFDVSGAATSPYDVMAEALGDQTSDGNVTAATISPSTANGLVITTIGVDSNTINGLATGTPGNFLSAIPTPITPDNPVDQNNGWALWYNPSAAPGTFVWTTEGGQVDLWASLAVAFEAAGGTGSPGTFSGTVSPTSATINVGDSHVFTVQISSVNGFQGQVSLSCPNPPAGISCQFTPTPVQLNANGTATPSLTVSVTSKPTAAVMSLPRFGPKFTFPLATLQVIAGFVGVLLIFVLHRNRLRKMPRLRFVDAAAITFLIVLALRLAACGGAGSATGPPPPLPISVSVSPTSTSVQVSTSANFTAAVQNDSQNKGVVWSLSGAGCSGAACGTLSGVTTSSVTYTAPTAVPAPATVTLTATSIADSSKSAPAIISISATPVPISVQVSVQGSSGSTTVGFGSVTITVP